DLGHAGGGTKHCLFGHAYLEEPIRMRVAEDVHVGVLGQIGGEPDNLGAFVGQPGERVAERGAGGLLTRVGERSDHRRGGELRGGLGGVHPRKPSSSWSRAICHSSASTRMKCAFSRVSSSGTPRPMRVSQISTDGEPGWSLRSSK